MGQSAHARRRRAPYRFAWARFVRRQGWRAYAILLLTGLSVVVLLRTPPGAQASSRSATRRPGGHAAAASASTRSPRPTIGSRATAATTNTLTSRPTTAEQLISLPADTSPCSANTAPQLVLVSISTQQAWLCAGPRQVYATPVTTGNVANGDATPLGTWRVQAKQANRYLTGPGYSDFVHFWVPFNGDFGLHDASWQTMPFGSPQYQTDGSHGCVHFPTPAMTWLYAWITVGSQVTIQANA